ncbi:MAG: chitobiase/beta-hexosaminidase C-terminal domain-containing protein [Verrucomicrobiales bacterium]|nr:chitobiase/beta-hexosaminidase C-terminal domain-containing protein [Verrucomicrobiales bacterium]
MPIALGTCRGRGPSAVRFTERGLFDCIGSATRFSAIKPLVSLTLALTLALISRAQAKAVSAPTPALAPEISPERGFHCTPFQVTLKAPRPDANIRYTTNGSVPSLTNGMIYSTPIRITGTTTLRAATFQKGFPASAPVTHSYLFLRDVAQQDFQTAIRRGFPTAWGNATADYGLDPKVVGSNHKGGLGDGPSAARLTNALVSIPTLSLVTGLDNLFGRDGLYTQPEQHGREFERPVSAELIFPDGRKGFQIDAGLRIQGGFFRQHSVTPKHSFRLIFRKTYGPGKLRFPLFGNSPPNEFDTLTLRAGANDGWQWEHARGRALYIRDSFVRQTLIDMGGVAARGLFVQLYLNGLYWGLYEVAERPDAAFAAAHFGGKNSEWEALNDNIGSLENCETWHRMIALCLSGLAKPLSVPLTPSDRGRVRHSVRAGWVNTSSDVAERRARSDAPYLEGQEQRLIHGLASDEAYQRIQGKNPDGSPNPKYEPLLDAGSLIDYMIVNIYCGTGDWPARNFWVARRRVNGTGFKFFPWDAEMSLGLMSAVNVNIVDSNLDVAFPYAAARANAEFRLEFADRVHRHFFNGGALCVEPDLAKTNSTQPRRNIPAARFARLAQQVDHAIIAESTRWGDQHARTPYTRDEHWEPECRRVLEEWLTRRSEIVLKQLRAAGLYPTVDAPSFSQQGGAVRRGFRLRMRAPSGTIHFTVDGSDPRKSEAAAVYRSEVAISERTRVKARALNDNVWSALNEASFVIEDSERANPANR